MGDGVGKRGVLMLSFGRAELDFNRVREATELPVGDDTDQRPNMSLS